MLFLTMIFAVFLLFFRLYFFHNIVSTEVIFLYFFNFYFLICRQILFYFILLIFIAILFFLPFFLFRLLIFFVSFQFLFFSPQKLTYFTMIMLGHHTCLHYELIKTINKQVWLAFSRNNRKIFWGGMPPRPPDPPRGGDSNSPDSPEGRGKSRNVTL